MTQEDKELLLKDLCARLPYGVKVLADIDKTFDGGCIGIINKIEPYVGDKFPELKGQYLLYEKGCLTPLVVDEVRPYLRPMSSMTEKERREFSIFTGKTEVYIQQIRLDADSMANPIIGGNKCVYWVLFDRCIDWLLSHHFDFRGLISKGLALEANEGMYKTE